MNWTQKSLTRTSLPAPRCIASAAGTTIVATAKSGRLRKVDDLARLGSVKTELDRASCIALALDPAAVAIELLEHGLGKKGRTTQISRLRRVAETVPQQAVGKIDDLGAADLVVGKRHGH